MTIWHAVLLFVALFIMVLIQKRWGWLVGICFFSVLGAAQLIVLGISDSRRSETLVGSLSLPLAIAVLLVSLWARRKKKKRPGPESK